MCASPAKYDQACKDLASTEKLYGVHKQIQEKITRLQNIIANNVGRGAEIETVYNGLVSEYKSSIQQLDNQAKVHALRSNVSDTRPMLNKSQLMIL